MVRPYLVLCGVWLVLAACGQSADDKDDHPRESLDALSSEPIEIGKRVRLKGDAVKADEPSGSFGYAFQKLFALNLEDGAILNLSTSSSVGTCFGIDEEPGEIEGPFFTLTPWSTPKTPLVTTKVGKEQQVPSFEFPGKVSRGQYTLEVLWLATAKGCSVDAEITLEKASPARLDEFSPIKLALGKPLDWEGKLTPGGNDMLWTAYGLRQEFRLTLTQETPVRFFAEKVSVSCAQDIPPTAAFYSVYDYQRQENLADGDFAADFLHELGNLAPGLYGFQINLGSSVECTAKASLGFE